MFFPLILFILPSFSQDFCPYPSNYYEQFSACIVYDDKGKTFDEASTECKEIYNGDLISIHNAFQNAIITSMARNINGEAKVIIGLHSNATNSSSLDQWQWTDGSDTDFYKWGRGEPFDCEKCENVYLDVQDQGNWYAYIGESRMMTSFCQFLPGPSPNPDCEWEWSGWMDTSNCTEDCGGCGWKIQERQCLSFNSCSCRGEDNRIWTCGIEECTFPSPVCCMFHSKYLNMTAKRYECIEEDPPSPSFLPIPCIGTWTDWISDDYCSDICGMCGWQPKERFCQPDGCICQGPSREFSPCNNTLCEAPRSNCCHGYSKQFDFEKQIYDCQPIE